MHYKFHHLAPDVAAYVRQLVAERGMKATCERLSTTEITLENLLGVGAPGATRDRIERDVIDRMRAEGLSPVVPERAPPPRKVREPGFPKVRSQRTVDELAGVRRGQEWIVTEPTGREFHFTVRYIVRDEQRFGGVVYGVTPRGKTRAVGLARLVSRRFARLVKDVELATARAS